ncbi:MAG: Rrf2 family transcriptional regulator [Phycisphaerales bacterium]
MLTQATGNAASALGYLAAVGGGPELVKAIAEACEIPAPYLAKIVNTLARANVVSTQRGIGGGVTLTSDPEDLTIYRLCEVMGDPITQPRCMLGAGECSDERACPAHRFAVAQRDKTLTFLRETTIADIAAFEAKRRWGVTGRPPNRDDANDKNGAAS